LSPELSGVAQAAEEGIAAIKAELAAERARVAQAEQRAAKAETDAAAAKTAMANMQQRLEALETTSDKAFAIAEGLSYAAQQLSSQSEEVAEAMVVQKDRSRETATAMEEMNATVLEVARSAENAARGTEDSKTKALEGQGVVERSVIAIRKVETVSNALEESMATLGERATSIGTVMNVITEIADQTNLLALNAAIEAARAGEAGRGFAVVADEVRKLAEKTMVATGEVEQSIKAIQEAVEQNVMSMQTAAEAVTEAMDMAETSGQALNEIVSFAEANADQVRAIATASEEQSATSEEINRAVTDIDALSDRTNGEMDAANSTVDELRSLADDLTGVFMQLRGAKEDAQDASDGKSRMLGVLPKLMLDFVAKRYGPDVRKVLSDELGSPVFMVQKSYPDEVIQRMASVVARETGQTEAAVLHDLGFYTPGEFARLYKKYFRTTNLKDFLLSLNDVHAQVTRDMPGAKPPRFDFEDRGQELVMNYESERGLFDYYTGVLKGAAEHFGEPIQVEVEKTGSTTARAVIRFLNA
jgi:methyl-accepting chemotaxis protein